MMFPAAGSGSMAADSPTDTASSGVSGSDVGSQPVSGDGGRSPRQWWHAGGRVIVGVVPLLILLVTVVAPVVAQPPTPTPTPAAGTGPSDICTTDLAETIRNMILMIQFGGPLLGGLVGAGAMLLKPVMRGEDMKRKMKQLRDGAIIWGVVAAPLFVTTIQYVVTGVVVGAPTCSII